VDAADLDNRFSYHAPVGDQTQRYEAIRARAKDFAALLNGFCPDSQEKSLAITALEESVMWANASIARNETAPAAPAS
jgi:hypothetical protein